MDNALERTNEQMETMTNNQVVAMALSPICDVYFANLNQIIAAESVSRALHAENPCKMIELQKRDIEV